MARGCTRVGWAMPARPQLERPLGAADVSLLAREVILLKTEAEDCHRTPEGTWSRTVGLRWHELWVKRRGRWAYKGDGCWTDVELRHRVRMVRGDVLSCVKDDPVPCSPHRNPRQRTRGGEQAHRLRFDFPRAFACFKLPTHCFLHAACAWAFGPRPHPAGAETFARFVSCTELETDHLFDRAGRCDPNLCIAGWVEAVSGTVNLERAKMRLALQHAAEARGLLRQQKEELKALAADHADQLEAKQATPAKKRTLADRLGRFFRRGKKVRKLNEEWDQRWKGVVLSWTVQPGNPWPENGISVFESDDYRDYGVAPLEVVDDLTDAPRHPDGRIKDPRASLDRLCVHYAKVQSEDARRLAALRRA